MGATAKKILKIIAIVLSAAVVLLGLFVVWATWEREPTEMLDRVNSIEVPSSWELKNEEVVGKINLCLDKSGCPSVRRVWQVPQMYSADELDSVFAASDIRLDFEDQDCLNGNEESGFDKICGAGYSDDMYRYTLYQHDDSPYFNAPNISLSIQTL